MTWEPIETAPKDASEIILRRGDRVTSGNWFEETDYFDAQRGEMTEFPDPHWMTWDGGFTEEEPPTHWMPLPPPPGDGAGVSFETKAVGNYTRIDNVPVPQGSGIESGDRVRVTVEKINE